MKKLRKRMSFLTKIMLVIGLLISNLSSLSVVFADEVTMNVSLVDDKLNIKYLDELADEVETVRVDVYENYTYFDLTSEKEVVGNYDLTPEELEMLVSSEEGKSLVVDTILSSIVFDGIYNVTVEIIDTTDGKMDEELIDTCDFSMEVLHKSGLEISLVDATTGLEVGKLEDGRYSVDYTSPVVKVVAKILSGGLNPTDIFTYEDEDYFAEDLLALEFASEMDFGGRLYGDYKLPIEVKLLNLKSEEVVYSENVNILYGDYDINALMMNSALETEELLSLSDSYVFYGNTKDGVVYALLNKSKTNTMLDLYKIANFVFEDDEYITYILSNDEYDDVLSSYDETTSTVSLEEYLDMILLDETAMLSLVNEGLTVTYKVVMVGDLNNDNALTEDDLLELINQVVGQTPIDVDKSNLYKDAEELDGVVDTLDVMYLDQVIKNETWNVELLKEDASLLARLDVLEDDIVSGDEFTISYVLTLSDYAINGVAGLFKYDDSMLELLSIETSNGWLGNSNDGKFLYLGTESLTGTEVVDENDEMIVVPNEYVVVTAKFRALSSGVSLVSVENPEYFNQTTYLVLDDAEVSTSIVVNASDDNSLSSLTISGQNISLEENVLDYEITVGNDVTDASVEAIVANVAASITSIVAPEKLVEGTNTITVTVTSESGNEKVYTITVIREKTTEDKTTTTPVNYNDYSSSDYEEDEDGNVVTPIPDENDDVQDDVTSEKEESDLSRIIIIILILLVIAGLIYLIFKDDDDEETKKTNKEINKLKKEVKEPIKKTNNKTAEGTKNKNTNNKKKER